MSGLIRKRGSRFAVTALIVALVVAGVVAALTIKPGRRHASADFASTVSLYPGAHVEVLGVTVGSVTNVAVQGTHVHVDLDYDPKYRLPIDVRAAIVPPSIVGDRYIALGPQYRGGATLPDGANLGLDRTAVPMELGDAYQALDKLATALGPHGANSDGALSRLLTASAHNLDGNGAQLNTTMHDLSQAMGALSDSRGDIAGTVTNLSKLSQTLAADDPQVRALVTNLATTSTELNGQRQELHDATTNLSGALDQVAGFVQQNRNSLTADVGGLTQITGTVARHQRDLATLLDLSPLGLSNLADAAQPENYDPAHPEAVAPQARTTAVTSRSDSMEDLPTQLGFTMTAICGSLPAGQQQQLAPLCTALRQSGGRLGEVISRLLSPPSGSGGMSTEESATTLAQLLGGQR